jgi:TPR repeat protein
MFRWFRRGAEAGDDSALVRMARCYLEGQGVARSPEAALRCLAAALQSDLISDDDREEAEELMSYLRPRTI